MKKIECIVRFERLWELAEALRLAGVGGMTATEVKGFGKQTTRPDNYLFLPNSDEPKPKRKLRNTRNTRKG